MRTIWGKSVEVPERTPLIPRSSQGDGFKGRAFRPHGTDSVGRVVEVSGSSVTFAYDHAPEQTHSMGRAEFHTFFAAWIGGDRG